MALWAQKVSRTFEKRARLLEQLHSTYFHLSLFSFVEVCKQSVMEKPQFLA